jgi:hypothetical protein
LRNPPARYRRTMKGALPKTSPLHRLSPRPSLQRSCYSARHVVGVPVVVVVGVPVVVVVGVPVVEVVGVPVVEVVGVPVVEVVGVPVVVLLVLSPGHLPLKSQGWFFRWRRRACLGTKSVRALAKSHAGTWQTGTKHLSSSRRRRSSSSASAREGISEAMAVPAKSFSARRRLSEPSATARASSSKPWPLVESSLVGSSDTGCPLSY